MKILIVDDDSNLLVSYERSLRKQFTIDTALGGEAGLAKIDQYGPYAVVLSDMTMPGMNGIQFLARTKEVAPQTVRMMLTGNADLKTAVDALNSGSIFRFLLKPCLPDDLAINLEIGIEQYRLIHAEKELLEKTLHGSIRLLIEILALVNPELFGKAQILRGMMRSLAEGLGLPDVWKLELIALLSQVGVVTLPPNVIQKLHTKQKLTDEEAVIVQRIPEIGHNLIVKIPRLEPVAEAIRYGCQHYDGTGFPQDGVKEHGIPIGARILKILTDLLEVQSGGVKGAGAFGLLRRRHGLYDPHILEAAEFCFAPERKIAVELPSGHPVTSEHLTSGLLLTSDIETKCGLLLVSAGHTMTEALLERVHNFSELYGLKEPIFVVRPEALATRPTNKAA